MKSLCFSIENSFRKSLGQFYFLDEETKRDALSELQPRASTGHCPSSCTVTWAVPSAGFHRACTQFVTTSYPRVHVSMYRHKPCPCHFWQLHGILLYQHGYWFFLNHLELHKERKQASTNILCYVSKNKIICNNFVKYA